MLFEAQAISADDAVEYVVPSWSLEEQYLFAAFVHVIGLPVGIHVSPMAVGLRVGDVGVFVGGGEVGAFVVVGFVNTQLLEDVSSAPDLHSLKEPLLSHPES